MRPTANRNAAEAEEAAKQADLLKKQRAQDLKWVMGDPRGRRVMWRLLEDAKMFHPVFDGSSRTYYELGKKEFMLKYFGEVSNMPEFTLMQNEAKEKSCTPTP